MSAPPPRVRVRIARKAAKMSQADLAAACGWEGQSRISMYELGKRGIGQAELEQMADATGVSRYWMVMGEGDMLRGAPESNAGDVREAPGFGTKVSHEGMMVIPRYEVWLAQGGSNQVNEATDADEGEPHPEAFARAAGWAPSTHFSMRVIGDSMIEAGLRDGWSVVVDSRDRSPEPGEIYALRYNRSDQESVMVKYVEATPDGGLRLISANGSHPQFRQPIELTPEMAAKVTIIGRVVHVQGLMGRRRPP